MQSLYGSRLINVKRMFRKIYYTLSSGKNPKFVYYLSCYMRLLTPRFLCRKRLPSLLGQIDSRKDRDYIMRRVDYYCQINSPVALPSSAERLRDAWKRVRGGNVYQHDTYEFTRFFPEDNKWGFEPGDVIFVPENPSIVKSRPLCDDNRNSVVMKLDKVRHFIFVDDAKSFEEKEFKVIFRGKIAGKQSRKDFMAKFYGNPLFDVGDVGRRTDSPMEWRTGKMTIKEHLDYQFIMAIEGNDVASNLKWGDVFQFIGGYASPNLRDLVYGGNINSKLPLCRSCTRFFRRRGKGQILS